MALIIPPGFSHVVIELRLENDNEPIVTTIGVDNNGATGTQIPDLVYQAFDATFMGLISDEYWLERCTAYIGQDGTSPLVVDGLLGPSQGVGTGAPLPQNCAVLVRKRTDLGGRRGRGRMYLPGIAEGQVEANGDIGSVFVDAWQGQADSFYDILTGGGSQAATPPVVLHRSEGIGPEPLPTPIQSFTVESSIATQRRRLRK